MGKIIYALVIITFHGTEGDSIILDQGLSGADCIAAAEEVFEGARYFDGRAIRELKTDDIVSCEILNVPGFAKG